MEVPVGDYWFFKIGSTNEFYIDANLFRIYNELDMNNQKIIKVATPTDNTDVANKAYVDSNSGSGGVSLSGTNTWTGINTFTAVSFSVNSSNIYLGDSGSDTINCVGELNMTNDIDMNDNDITNVDMLEVDGTCNLDSTVNLGNSSGDNIFLKGELNVSNNYDTFSLVSAPYVSGRIKIKLGSTFYYIYCTPV